MRRPRGAASAGCGAPGRVLIARGGAIGDFILTLPVLAALRAGFPGARIEVLGYPHIAGLAVAGGLADAVHPIESGGLVSLFVPDASVPEEVGRFLSGFGLVISFLHDPDRVFEGKVRSLSNATFLRGPYRPDERLGRHATAVLLEPLATLGLEPPDPVPRLHIPAQVGAAREQHGAPLLAVHPGSGSERKNWPEASWARLLGRLASQTSWRLLLVGGEAEAERLGRLAGYWPAERLELAQNAPLVELAQRLHGCAGFLGHDSGITHLAAALGLRVLALWGETSQDVWRPLGHKVRLLYHPSGLAALDVATVVQACHTLLAHD